jgi:ectoine hydroxylase-related dioxygenase (phytanoyl-CoA dioxygenase family)
MQSLSTDGYAIFQALDSTVAEKHFAEFLTWRNLVKPPVPPHGVIKHYQIGHLPLAWELRTSPEIYTPFQRILKSKDLVASFDGFGYLPKGTGRRNKAWHHIDQAPKDLSFQGVQGLVALTSNSKASFQCVPRSHKEVASYYLKKPAKYPAKRWQKIDLEDFNQTLDLDLKTETIDLQAGELLIWDSRLIHLSSYDPSEERCVFYVSYRKRQGLSSTQAAKRLRAFDAKRTTSHWAYPLELNSLQPQIWGDQSKLIDYSKLPELNYSEDLLLKIKQFL